MITIPIWAFVLLESISIGIIVAVFVLLRRRDPKCSCKHPLANHDPDTLICNTTNLISSSWVSCPCLHYVGPSLPEGWIGPAMRKIPAQGAGQPHGDSATLK